MLKLRLNKVSIPLAIAFTSAIISCIVLIGWLCEFESVLSLIPGAATMNFNTALSFLLLSVGTYLSFKHKKQTAGTFTLSILIILIGLFTLFEYWFSFPINIDNLFVLDTFSTTLPGRMSQASAFCFLLSGISLLFVQYQIVRLKKVIQAILLVITFIASVSIISFILQVSITNKVLFLNTMAIHTSVLFLVLSRVIAFLNPNFKLTSLLIGPNSGSKFLRSDAPFFTIIPVLLGALFLFTYHKGIFEIDFAIVICVTLAIFLSLLNSVIIATRSNKDDLKRKVIDKHLKTTNQELSYFKQGLDASSIVATTDKYGIITYVNDKFCKISKYDVEEIIGKTHRIINSGYHPKEFFEELWGTIKTGKIWVGDIKNKAKDGSFYWVHTSIVPFLDEHGEIYQYLAIRQDITKKKEQEETLASNYVKALEQRNSDMEQLTYITSHDLQEPLLTITSFIDLFKNEYSGKLEGGADQYIDFITEASARMSVLVRGLLEYSRIGSKKQLTAVDTDKLVREVVGDLSTVIIDKHGSVSLDELPTITAYSMEVRMLFQNLIANAIKFSQKGVPPVVNISAIQEKKRWLFKIEDNGIGISKKNQKKIFQIFQRLHNESEYEGTGIGLAHCKKILDTHNGKIWLESTPNEGSTFYFTIPC